MLYVLIFREDGERVIADTFNTVPFGIRVGRSLVNIEDSLNSNILSLHTVSSEFTQNGSHLLDPVWSFLIGTRHRGIQSTEQMLLCGTRITAIGAVTKGINNQLCKAYNSNCSPLKKLYPLYQT
jgi:hypothetical protein